MEQFTGFESELGSAAAIFAAVLAANAARWLWRRVGDYVKGTHNKIDDKIFAAVKQAVREASGQVTVGELTERPKMGTGQDRLS